MLARLLAWIDRALPSMARKGEERREMRCAGRGVAAAGVIISTMLVLIIHAN